MIFLPDFFLLTSFFFRRRWPAQTLNAESIFQFNESILRANAPLISPEQIRLSFHNVSGPHPDKSSYACRADVPPVARPTVQLRASGSLKKDCCPVRKGKTALRTRAV